MLTATAASLPFIHISVNVKSFAFIRPVTEVSLIRAPSNGRIVEVIIRENQPVQKDEVLFVIESDVLNQKEVAFVIRMEDAESVNYDLRRLTTSTETLAARRLNNLGYQRLT